MTEIAFIDGNVQDGSHDVADRGIDACVREHAGVADEHGLAIDRSGHAVACDVARFAHALGVDLARVGRAYRLCDGVIGEVLRVRRDFEQFFFGVTVRWMCRDDLERAVGESAGLIEDDGVDLREYFEVIGTLNEYADLGGTADTTEEGERYRDDEGAGAAHDEEGEATEDPVGPGAGDGAADEGERHGRAGDGRGVDAGEARDEVLGLGLFLACVFYELEDAAHGRFAERLGGAYVQKARHVDAAGYNLVAHLDMTGNRFSGKGRGVELRYAFGDDAVDGHAFTGLDDDDGADFDFIGINLVKVAVSVLDIGEVGRDVHHGRDGLAAFAYGIGLEELAYLVEEHDGSAFGHMWVGVGKEDHREGADGGHRHEEAFVKCLAATNIVVGLLEHVVTGDEERHEEQYEARVESAHIAEDGSECPQLIESVYDNEDAQREEDTVELVLLRLFLAALLLFLFYIGCHDPLLNI